MAQVFDERELNIIVNDYISKLKGKISIDKVILFGSYATGKATELSDIDLLIVSKDLSEDEPKGANGYYLDTLVGEFNPNLEVIAVHPAKLDHPVNKDFFEEVVNTGKFFTLK